MAVIQPLQIDAHAENSLPSDFSRLRQHSIDLLQELTGETWTDYNLHDPGVTILELLCFAITDLSYRTGFPLTEILSLRHEKHREWENAFFPVRQILPTSAITISDFRKVILDEVGEISNVWIEPVVSNYSSDHVKGLYYIYAQANEEIAAGLLKDLAGAESLKGKIKKAFVSRRNICEDCLREVVLMQPVMVQVFAEVEVNERWVPEQVLADIYDKMSEYFNAKVRIHSEEELLQRGWTTENLYTGVLLKRGFIPDTELTLPLRQIDPADLIELITRVEGVLLVKNLSIKAEGRSTDKAPLLLEILRFPLLDKSPGGSHIKLYKNRYELQIRDPVLRDLLPAFRQKRLRQQRMKLSDIEPSSIQAPSTEDVPGGVPLNLSPGEIEKYYSIQDHFPLIYGIGAEGLPYTDPSRRAKALQLKGYLLLFEQIMANYLSQLAHLSDFFSIRVQADNHRSYYSQPLFGVPGVADLLKEGYEQVLQEAMEPEEVYQKRKNAVYDHLLARYNEVLDEYPVTLYDHLYGENRESQKFDTLLKWKAVLLNSMPELSHDRARAFDYSLAEGDKKIVVGLEKRMLLLLHIPLREKRSLMEVFHQKDITLGEAREKHAGARPRAGAIKLENETISLFRYGIDPANYRIEPQVQERGKMQVLYKEPEGKEWKVIAKGQNREGATKLIETMVYSLKQISLESEGFHLVEHVLLRPTLTGAAFGWGLYAREKNRLARHKDWLTFAERENAIQEVVKLAGPEGGKWGVSAETDRLGALCRFEQDPELVRQYLRLYQRGGKQFFPRWEMYTRRWGHSMLREDFFNFRMTVALPAWPARFQSKNFRMYVEELFQRHGPAHLRLHFLWLGISEMQKFERLYFDWKDLFISREGNLDSCEQTEKLIDLIHLPSFRVV